MRVPVIPLSRVLHIGTLDPADFGRNSGADSQGGRCLAVSLCPHAWRRIAKLGESPLHELTRQDGAFVDATAIRTDPELLDGVLGWGRARGLVEDREVWRAWIYDEGGWRCEDCATFDAAVEAADGGGLYEHANEIPGPDGGPAVEPLRVAVGTPALAALTGLPCAGCDATDAAIMAWAMTAAPALLGRPLDGVWWRDRYRPELNLVPRGAVFPARVGDWAVAPLSWSAVVDTPDALADTHRLDAALPPGVEHVGRNIDDPDARRSWVALMLAVHAASQPGGPLDGWVFHGTSREDAEAMAREGMDATEALLRDPISGDTWWSHGTYWARSWIAGFYAEDRCEADEDPGLPLALVAARLEDVAAEGDLVADEQSVDCPLHSRLGRPADAIQAAFEASQQDWEASLEHLGTFVCLGPVGAEKLRVISGPEQLAALLREAGTRPGSHRPR